MKILYDYQTFTWQRYGGISNSFVKLIENLPMEVSFDVGIKYSCNIHLKNSKNEKLRSIALPEGTFDRFGLSFRSRLFGQMGRFFPYMSPSVKNHRETIRLLKNGNFDVFHPTFFDDYFLPYLNEKPFVLTVHDMIPELFHINDPQIDKKKILVEKAAHIVTVSNKTKMDLVEILKVPEKKVTTIYHGAPERKTLPSTNINIMNGIKYILYVGKREGYKAFLPMIRSIGKWLRVHRDIKIVCTGDSFCEREHILFNNEDIENQMLYIHPDDNEMEALYKNALCFIFPSFYEGFGIPILEAYSFDCPVFLSRHSCFPEIAGDAAVYFDIDEDGSTLPEELDSFLLWSENKRSELLQKQRKRLSLYSWKKSAMQLAKVYEMVKCN